MATVDRGAVLTMPPWELKALEYIVGAVLLGLALVVSTDADPLCKEGATRDRTIFPAGDVRPDIRIYGRNLTIDVCVNDNGP